MSSKGPGTADDYDVFKDSLIRYLGYANEVGEAFRVLVPVSVVRASYGVSSGYVLSDAIHKYIKTSQQPVTSGRQEHKSPALAFTDTLVWQALASVIIPGFTINRICWATNMLLNSAKVLPPMLRKWGTTAVGIGCIPFIVHPIDHGVDYVMDHSLRSWYGYHPRKHAAVRAEGAE